MKISPIKNINRVSFGAGNMNNNMTSSVGLLSLQNSDKLNFEKSLKLTQNADAVQSNPLVALGCKFAKAYNILFSPTKTNLSNDATYIHLPYMA